MPEMLHTDAQGLTLRFIQVGEESLLAELFMELAVYEKMESEMQATPELLHHALFIERSAEAILAFEGEAVVGYMVFFHNFSTFIGKRGLYLEDLFVRPAYRSKGYGKAMLLCLLDLAKQRDCARMEWACLDWNTPSIEFYKRMGAQALEPWTTYRMILQE